jgi:uncharacterized protein DUF4386
MTEATRTRLGMAAVAASGVITAAMIVVRGTFIDPSFTPEAFAKAGGSATWIAYSLGTVLGIWLGVYGFIALYAYLSHVNPKTSRIAFWGMVLNIGLILLLPALGVYAFAGPPLADLYRTNPQLSTQLSAQLGTPFYLLTIVVQGILYCVGSLLLGIAIWRSGTLPKWTGAFFFLQAPLIQFVPLISYPGELLGALMLAVSSVWIAYTAVRRG